MACTAECGDLRNVAAVAKSCDGGAEVRLWSVPEFDDERMTFERLLHDAALHAAAPPMNEADLPETALTGSGHVFLDDRLDVAGIEGVEVENILNRNAHG